jgi:hypothetical protein
MSPLFPTVSQVSPVNLMSPRSILTSPSYLRPGILSTRSLILSCLPTKYAYALCMYVFIYVSMYVFMYIYVYAPRPSMIYCASLFN